MKLKPLLLLVVFLLVGENAFSQVTISEKNAPVTKIIDAIGKQTGYTFLYDEAKLKLGYITIDLKNATLDKALNECFKDSPVTYNIIEKTIVLTPKKEEGARTENIEEKARELFFIMGKITDSKDELISGATVYLTNSKKAAITGIDGTFRLSNLQPGTYELVVNMLGFTPATQNITIQKQSLNINIKLSASITPINEIVVKEKPDPNRARYLKIFTKNFIGESANAAACKILNPDVIKLHYNKEKNMLEARSDDFIKIENRALGYTVSYLLTRFEYDINNQYFAYEGKPYFEELKDTEIRQKQWEHNRKKAYEGSIRHFFKALFNNTAEGEGFLVYRIPVNASVTARDELAIAKIGGTFLMHQSPIKLTRDELLTARPINSDSLFTVIDRDFKLLKLNSANEPRYNPSKLFIAYTKEEEPAAFYNTDEHIELPLNHSTKKWQVSQIAPIVDGILLDKNGSLDPVNNIIYNGYWIWERVADLMPFDYTSSKTPKTKPDQ